MQVHTGRFLPVFFYTFQGSGTENFAAGREIHLPKEGAI